MATFLSGAGADENPRVTEYVELTGRIRPAEEALFATDLNIEALIFSVVGLLMGSRKRGDKENEDGTP